MLNTCAANNMSTITSIETTVPSHYMFTQVLHESQRNEPTPSVLASTTRAFELRSNRDWRELAQIWPRLASRQGGGPRRRIRCSNWSNHSTVRYVIPRWNCSVAQVQDLMERSNIKVRSPAWVHPRSFCSYADFLWFVCTRVTYISCWWVLAMPISIRHELL